MKKLVLALSTVAVFSGSAVAADLPARTYSKAPAAVVAAYDWSGCYVGVNAGYGWNSGNTRYIDPNVAPNADPINFVGTLDLSIPTPRPRGSGWLGGGGAGCNWQSKQWVLGIEADIDAAHIFGSNTNSVFTGPLADFQTGPGVFTSINNTGTANEQISLRWLSTVRARAGVTVQERILLFATAGLAVGGVNTQGSVTTSSPFAFFVNPAWAGSNTTTKVGGVIGAGAEWAFFDRWTVKAEYLWYNLGSASHSLNCVGLAGCGTTFYATLGNATSSVSGSVVRMGINYRFGGPVVANY
jgi:outer membrane immunogenic protein